jgi:hypothetical protein
MVDAADQKRAGEGVGDGWGAEARFLATFELEEGAVSG